MDEQEENLDDGFMINDDLDLDPIEEGIEDLDLEEDPEDRFH